MAKRSRRIRASALVVGVVLAAATVLAAGAEAAVPDSPPLRAPVYGTDVHEAGIRNFPDPALLRAEGRWFAFSSNSTGPAGRNIAVMRSTDLWDWTAPRGDQPTAEALPHPPSWARSIGQGGSFWAPSVLAVGGHYVLYFAARHRSVAADRPGWCIGAARADSPSGPYTAVDAPVVCRVLGNQQASSTSRSPGAGQGLIDPFVYRAPNGAPYLLAKGLDRAWQLQGMRLTTDGLRVTGQAHGLLYLEGQTHTWEYSNQLRFSVMENPAMDYNTAARGSGRPYTLYYSGGEWQSQAYATGYATCRTPVGPCTKATTGRAWLRSSRGVAGPGGLTVVRGEGGQKWVGYHSWAPDAIAVGEGRRLHVEPLGYRGAAPVLQQRSPRGTFTATSDAPGAVTFAGRAHDPDTGRPVTVTVREEGVVVARTTTVGGHFSVTVVDVDPTAHRYYATFRDDHRAPNTSSPPRDVTLGP